MEYIQLVGAEQVQHAANSISQSAETMRRVAGEIESSLHQQRQFMDDWLNRFENVLIEDRNKRGF